MGFLDSAGRFIAHNGAAVTGIGAGLGAAAGVGREMMKAPEERSYLGGALRGAAVGGIAGGATHLGGSAMRNTMLLRPELQGAGSIAKATAGRVGTDASNMMQRQFHGLTGYGTKDHAYLDRIGVAGTHSADKSIDLAHRRFMDAMSAGGYARSKPNVVRDYLGLNSDPVASAHEAEHGMREAGAAAQRLRDLGMSSAPGSVKAMVTNPREASKALWNQMAGSGGAPAAAMAVGGTALPAVLGARDIARGDESATGGQTVGEKVMRTGAQVGTGALFAGLPMGAMSAAGMGVENLAARLGRRITPPKPLQTAPTAPA